jgi:exosortase/archaeosortase family protein
VRARTWLLLQMAAMWPHALWMARRIADGSDDALGPVAIGTLSLLLLARRRQLRDEPRLGWLLAGAASTCAGTLALLALPPMVAALLAVLGFAMGLSAWTPAAAPRLPLAGLAVLSLPLLASLQFYLGYPLRLVAATLAGGMLRTAGIAAERSGAALQVDGRLVLVDAPCSGVQMAWLAYFTAFTVAALAHTPDARLLRRMPWIGAGVLVANAVRNAVLVGLEARPAGLWPPLHEAIGAAILALLCCAIAWLMLQGVRHERLA